jgi:hypothetical protein
VGVARLGAGLGPAVPGVFANGRFDSDGLAAGVAGGPIFRRLVCFDSLASTSYAISLIYNKFNDLLVFFTYLVYYLTVQ